MITKEEIQYVLKRFENYPYPDQIRLMPVVGKQPIIKNWPRLSAKQLLTEYPREWVSATGIGVILGEGISTLDVDTDDLVDGVLANNPWAADTFQTKGQHGRKVWCIIEGEY